MKQLLALLLSFGCSGSAIAQQKPVKVFILSGEANMLGLGKIDGGGKRWGKEILNPKLSVYEGNYEPNTDYENAKPLVTMEIEAFGGVDPTPFLGGGTQVVRGEVVMPTTGMYQFRPGWDESVYNRMEIDGKLAHEQKVGKAPKRQAIKLEGGRKLPFRITYFTEAAGSIGFYRRLDATNTLSSLVYFQNKYPYLLDQNGNWKWRNDVYHEGLIGANGGNWLSPICGSDKTFGPEIGFGKVVGDYTDEPVLLIKAAQGNRSLGWDFLPPGSEQFEFKGEIYAGYGQSPPKWRKDSQPKPMTWYAGKQYDDCLQEVQNVLDNFDKRFPHWKGRGYEIAGFVWWQGEKDRKSEAHATRYEQNLVRLIRTMRQAYQAPKAKFVLATLGQTERFVPSKNPNDDKIIEAQIAVDGSEGKYPKFKGNVRTVYTNPLSQGGNSNDHYYRNAQTYMDVGLAMGQAMVDLLKAE